MVALSMQNTQVHVLNLERSYDQKIGKWLFPMRLFNSSECFYLFLIDYGREAQDTATKIRYRWPSLARGMPKNECSESTASCRVPLANGD